MLNNHETIFKEFQAILSQFTNVTDEQTNKRIHREMTYDRISALCIKVHRAVKTAYFQLYVTHLTSVITTDTQTITSHA